jgi:hypothetical protein
VAKCERKWDKILQPVVLPDLRGKGLVRKEAFLLTSLFGYFCGYKSDKASAATERNDYL